MQLTSIDILYALLIVVLIVVTVFGKRIHTAIKALETFVTTRLPAPVAAVVNAGLNKIDTVAQQPNPQNVCDLFSVLKELVHAGVENANVTQVNQAKQAKLFTQAVASAVKASVTKGVLEDLGPMKDELQAHIGDLEPIIGRLIETKVAELKKTA